MLGTRPDCTEGLGNPPAWWTFLDRRRDWWTFRAPGGLRTGGRRPPARPGSKAKGRARRARRGELLKQAQSRGSREAGAAATAPAGAPYGFFGLGLTLG